VSAPRRMLARVLGEHGLWARLTGLLERWTRRGGRRWTPGGAGKRRRPRPRTRRKVWNEVRWAARGKLSNGKIGKFRLLPSPRSLLTS